MEIIIDLRQHERIGIERIFIEATEDQYHELSDLLYEIEEVYDSSQIYTVLRKSGIKEFTEEYKEEFSNGIVLSRMIK